MDATLTSGRVRAGILRYARRIVAAAEAQHWRDIEQQLASCGSGVAVAPPVTLTTPERVSIGADTYIGPSAYLAGDGGLEIGASVMIGPYVYIQTSTHVFEGDDLEALPYDHRVVAGPVRIEDFAWLGGRVTVLPNVTIGRGAVVGAGSVVVKDIPPLAIAVGTPAEVIRHRDAALFERLTDKPVTRQGKPTVWLRKR